MTKLDLSQLLLPDNPSEWREVDVETALAANERNEFGLLTRKAVEIRREIMESRWYLVRNLFNWKSRNGRVERYFTTAGIERPYQGLWAVYAAYQNIVQDDELAYTITLNAHRIGAHEPITIEKAQQLYDRIRYKLGLRGLPKAIELRLGPRPGGWK